MLIFKKKTQTHAKQIASRCIPKLVSGKNLQEIRIWKDKPHGFPARNGTAGDGPLASQRSAAARGQRSADFTRLLLGGLRFQPFLRPSIVGF